MKFTIITHAVHKTTKRDNFSYEPYVREMNLWTKHASEVLIVAPVSEDEITSIESNYQNKNIKLNNIPSFNVLSFKSSIYTMLVLPKTFLVIYKAMKWADHIHLRCPGNIGLLGCFVQILFPNKPKTAKYAGNWDPKAKQPWSYRLQKWLLSNTFLTKNMKVLVYGEWQNQTKNIIPFFTASYSEKEIDKDSKPRLLPTKSLLMENVINFIFAGSLSKGKQPLLSVKVIHKLKEKGYLVRFEIYGEGDERKALEDYIHENNLENQVILYGNVRKETLKTAYKKAHFLLFVSNSEGWPKVVAEAMFWGCIPITSSVSCTPTMLADGKRGALVNANVNEMVVAVEGYLNNHEKYKTQAQNAMGWSRKYTLEKFEEEIGRVVVGC